MWKAIKTTTRDTRIYHFVLNSMWRQITLHQSSTIAWERIFWQKSPHHPPFFPAQLQKEQELMSPAILQDFDGQSIYWTLLSCLPSRERFSWDDTVIETIAWISLTFTLNQVHHRCLCTKICNDLLYTARESSTDGNGKDVTPVVYAGKKKLQTIWYCVSTKIQAGTAPLIHLSNLRPPTIP